MWLMLPAGYHDGTSEMTMSLIARLLLLLAAPIAALFVARDALKFDIVQMVVAVGLFTVFVAAIAFWPRRRKS